MTKMIALVAVAATLALAGCTDTSPKNVRLLESMGMTNVELGGYGWFACGENDVSATRFTAVGASGEPISGTLCSGWFKGTTVRFD